MVIFTEKGIVSPRAAAVAVVLFTTETFGAETVTVTVLDAAVPVSSLPSGGVYVKVEAA
ncbi:hypothetical protein D3C85_1722990 [compost metagenome]